MKAIWHRGQLHDKSVLFIRTAGLILVITGLAKVVSTFGTAKIMQMTDPILGIPFRFLLLGVGILELTIAGFCFLRRFEQLGTALVAWISTAFLVYRFGLWFVGWHHPCACMGNLTDLLHLSPQAADNLMKGLLSYMLIGSFITLFCAWKAKRSLKMSIPADLPLTETG